MTPQVGHQALHSQPQPSLTSLAPGPFSMCHPRTNLGVPLQGSLSGPRLKQCAGLVHQDPGPRWVTLSPRAEWVLTKYSLGMDCIISEDT